MHIEQTIEFELRGPWPRSRTCTPKHGYFHDKINISKANNPRGFFAAKNIAGGNVLCFFHLGQVTYKI